MLRRSFLSVAGAATLAPLGAVAGPAAPMPGATRLHRVRLAGTAYSDAPAVADRLRVGQPVQLRRLAEDRFDASAVEVHAEGARLGKVPGMHTSLLASLVDAGWPVHATVAAVGPSPARPSIEIDLFLGPEPA
jgi:hypothetical protein